MSDTKNDSRSLPECIGEYVRRLLKKMRYRRKVRDDVEAELTAHFEDELKDCKTSEEKEQKAQQLITDFGDIKLLAILLRRAKKRCRPLWRTFIARTFQAIGILIVCFIFYVIWFSFGEPTIRVDYIKLFNQINQPKILNQDNAWPHYEKAFELFVPRSPVVEQFISYRENRKERKDALRLKHMIQDNAQQINTWLDKNQQYWDNLSTEQQEILLKCLEYNSVPFPKIVYQSNNDWRTTTIELMTEHIIRCIDEETQITTPHGFGTLRSSLGSEHLRTELNNWLKNKTIPPNILEAVSVAALHEAIKRFKNLPEDISAPLTDVECEYIRGWIKQNEAAWKEFAAGSTKSYCYRPIAHDADDQDKSLWSIAMPPLNTLKNLARLGAWRCRINRTEGQLQQSIEDCLAVARAASHWQGKGTLVEQLVGMAISGLGHGEILTILADEKLSPDELQYLQEQLSKIYPGDYPLMNMEGERLTFMDVIQHSFTDGGPGGGHLIPGSWDELSYFSPPNQDDSDKRLLMPLYTAVSMAHARRDATVAKANEIFDLQNKIAKMTPYQRHVSDVKTADEIIYGSWQNYRFFLIQMLLPATARASEIAYRGKMGHEATKTITAILRWRQEKDQYPANLEQLVKAGFLDELPMDAFSDKPLVYKKTGDDFILYSAGFNFTDDGGEYSKDRNGNIRKWGDNGDTIFWPVTLRNDK
jgi:hypothetical protein